MNDQKCTKGQMESLISGAVSKFEKEYMGRGPKEIKTTIIKSHILIVVDGFLSQSEQIIAENGDGIKLIKEMRMTLFEKTRDRLLELIKEIVNVPIISTHSDVSTKTGEKVIVLSLNCDLEELL